MRAVRFDDQLSVQDDVPLSAQKSGDVVVDVLVAGICETDLQLCQGYMGFRGTLGHEFVGIARTGRLAGQRVVGEINCSCGHCAFCQQGLSNHCPHRTVIGILNHDGAFADSVVVPERNLHRVPDHVSNQQAVLVEPLAAACRIPQQLPEIAGQPVVILGDGRLGNLCAQVLRHHGCRVTVVGKHAFKQKLLSDIGLHAVDLDKVSHVDKAPFVVDCTGSSSGFELAVSLTRAGGCVVLKTTVAQPHTVPLSGIVIDELRVVGSRCGPFNDALHLLEHQAVETDSLVTDRFPLSDAIRAFERAKETDALKVLLDVAESAA